MPDATTYGMSVYVLSKWVVTIYGFLNAAEALPSTPRRLQRQLLYKFV